MGKAKRKLTNELIKELSLYDLEGSLQEAIDNFKAIFEEFPEYKDFFIDIEYYDEGYIQIRASRLETQEEADKRAHKVKQAKIAAQARKLQEEKKERAELERLLKKYSDTHGNGV